MSSSALEFQDYASGHNAAPSSTFSFSDSFTLFEESRFSAGFPINNDLKPVALSELSALDFKAWIQGISHSVGATLRSFAESSAYEEITGLAFGENYDQQIAESLRQNFLEGNLANLPQFQILDATILNGANGAYAAALNTIFLSDTFISNGSYQDITKVLLEEIGHFIDDQINTIDASGDEGDIFARLVLGQDLCLNELAYLKQEDDSGYLWLNGQSIAVEQDNTLSTARNMGSLVSPRTFTDWVGSTDTNDYYRFDIGTTSNFSLNLTGLSANANVRLLNSAGSVLQGSYLTGSSSESISRQLSAGTYYAQIYRATGDTKYILSLNATPLDYAGNTRSTARNVGTLVGSRSFTDWVSSVDTNDYYRFDFRTTSNFRLNLTGLSADANVRLLNSAGTVLQGSYLTGNSAESISRQLRAGTYYAQVYRASGDTNYSLSLNATPLDSAGNTLSAARNVGTLVGSRSFIDWVGSVDTNDYYRFDVGTTSNFSLSLVGLSADANVRLLNSAGSTLQGSYLTGDSSESISRQLSAGTYYAQVYSASGNTDYGISLNATPLDFAGNTLSAARNVGTLVGSRSFTDWVGSGDSDDYYRFDIGTTSNFSLSLTGLSANANVRLLNSAGTAFQSSHLTGNSAESISRQLSAGTYYVEVYRASGNTNYSLSLNATPLDSAGNTLSAARNVGTLVGSRSFTDWVGSIDTNDYYRFDVGTTSNFSLSLTGLRADANVRLLNSAGSILGGSYLTGNSAESISRQLNAGTYYAQVYRASGDTTYNLTLNATAISPDLVIQSPFVPSSVTVGNTVNINSYTRNQGTASAGYSYVRYWLSDDATLNTSSDRFLGNNYVGSLAAGSSEYDSFSFTYDASWGTGTKYIFFEADGYNYVTESNEFNNVAAAAITVGGQPDLVIQSPFAPSSVTVGNTVNINSYTRNQGTASAGYSYVRYWLSDDATLNTSSDRYLGENYVGSLAAGSSEYDSFGFTYNASWGTGTKYIFFEADGYGSVAESNEANNVAYRAITINPLAQPDLIVTDLYTPSSITVGDSISVSYYVRNQGAGTASSSYVNYWLSNDMTLSSDDYFLRNRSIASIGAGSSIYDSVSFSYSSSLGTGTKYILVEADGYNQVAESNEGNNIAYRAITINSLPQADLIIQNQSAPTSVTVGNTVNISSNTRNQGTANAGYSYVRYWLSDDATLNTSSDRYLGENYVGSLAAGSSEYDSFSFTYNSNWGTGTKYILFEADGYNYVTESNEFNNVAAAAITVNWNSGYVPPTYQAFDANQVFSLHSHSSANHTIYLDFDGHTTTNTEWNSRYNNGSSIATPAYDMDGNNTSFSTDERRNIWNIWRRVAEDFIPFNVNVTTAAPVLSDLIKSDSNDTRWGIRVVIGGNGAWYSQTAGGTAYLNSFNWNSDTPTFIFSEKFYSEKSIAEAVSHEVGHTLGLSHDGVTGGPEYYEGHNGWASIMGVGYYQELTQWSNGQYSGASNTQDDLAIITGNNGFGYRSDDYGSSLGTASSLMFNGSTVRTYGIIERNTDADWFRFESTGGNLSLNINAFEIGANLDILVRLYNSAGQIIATYDPTDSLSVLISRYLSLGTYYLSIQGTGKGDLTTGYSNYGSLGQYSITGTIV